MPIHDYSCDTCKTEVRDHYLPRLNSTTPICSACNTPMVREWTTNRTHRIFQVFDFTLDSGKVISIDSLAKLRKVEKSTTDAYHRGEPVRPFIFRHYSQDPTNKDKSIFSGLNPEQIDPKKARSAAGKMESGFVSPSTTPQFHPATLRALESQGRNRSRSR